MLLNVRYSRYEIERISDFIAMNRKNKVTLIDKANVLESSRLWRKVVCCFKKIPICKFGFFNFIEQCCNANNIKSKC